MEADSNNQLLRSMTKRERKTTRGGRSKDAIKAGARKDKTEAPESKPSRKLPGSELFKKLTSTTALNVLAFGVACFAIVQYGDKMAEYLEAQVPSEKAILEALKA